MTESNKKRFDKDEIPLEKRVMEVVLSMIVIVSLIYFFMLIVIL